MSDHIEVLEKLYSAALVESTDRNLTSAERQEAAAQYRALREAISSLRQVPDGGNRYGFSGDGVGVWATDAASIATIREWRHKAGIADALRARVAELEPTPAQAGAELPNIIDEALELMEMHGMHGEREYQQLAAAHRALTRRGGS